MDVFLRHACSECCVLRSLEPGFLTTFRRSCGSKKPETPRNCGSCTRCMNATEKPTRGHARALAARGVEMKTMIKDSPADRQPRAGWSAPRARAPAASRHMSGGAMCTSPEPIPVNPQTSTIPMPVPSRRQDRHARRKLLPEKFTAMRSRAVQRCMKAVNNWLTRRTSRNMRSVLPR
jgi:hypothetical protein